MTSLGTGCARVAAVVAASSVLAFTAVAGAAPRTADPPQAEITKAPKQTIKVRGNRTVIATWEFTADEPANFTCKLTHMGLVRPCLSPITYGGLTKGKWTFTVYATRPVKNLDSTRARDVITVKKKKHGRKHR
jgi:hypothetical protein